jgi:hypothetical protein
MPVWVAKTVSNEEWGRVQDMFENQFMTLGSPRDMMLVCVEDNPATGTAKLIASFPDETLLGLHPGFEEVTTLLVGDNAGFEECFAYRK